jgi:hypothetical protein
VTVPPTDPRDSDSERVGLTATDADAVWVALSVATTLCAPAVEAGTVNAQVNAPSEAAVTLQTGALAPENTTLTVEPAAKPFPVAVMEAPTAPFELERTKLGVTVKVETAELSPWLAVTVWRPADAAGMTRALEEKDPEAVVVAVPRMVPEGDSVSVTVESAAKPVPLAESELPTTLLETESESVEVTVKVAVATSGAAPPSRAVIVWDPATDAGMAKVQAMTPAGEVEELAQPMVWAPH